MTFISGLIAPFFGLLIVKSLFSMMLAPYMTPPESVSDAVLKWVLFMFVGAIAIFFSKGLSSILFALIGDNISFNVRSRLYASILRKHIGWHDDKNNSSGVMSATLASDASNLQGASAEGKAIQIES